MAVITGTSNDWKDLLADLRTSAVANGWTELDYTTGGTDEEPDVLYLEGPGITMDEKVYVQIRTHADVDELYYGWEIRTAIAFSPGLDFENQPGVSPATYMNLDDATINYRFYINDGRIVVVARISTFVMSCYAGFFLPFADPTEYPYPLYVFGSNPSIKRYTNVINQDRGLAGPGQNCAHVRSSGGQWLPVWNYNDNASFDTPHDENGYSLWPLYTGQASSQATVSYNLDLRPPQGETDAHAFWPVHIHGAAANLGVLGVLDGVYYGWNSVLNTEDTVDVGADEFRIYQSINRAGLNNFFWMKEE